MLDILLPAANQKFEVVPRRIEVPFGEGDGSLVRLSLPPVEELLAIKALPAQQLSVQQVADDAEEFFRGIFSDEAVRLEKKVQRFEGSSIFFSRLASLKELAGEFEDAQRHLEHAIALGGGAFAQLKLGTNLFRQKKIRDAKNIYSAESLKGNVDASLRLALLSVVECQFEDARKYANEAIQADALDYRARLFAGALCLANSEFELAIRHFRVAAEENPSSALVLVNLAVAHVCTGRPAKALRSLRTAVRLNPLNANAVAFLADLSFSQGVSSDAIPPLEAFLKYEQKLPGMWARLAQAYYLNDNFDKALKALRQEASLRDSASVWNNIGVCSWKKGEVSKAVQTFKYAITREEREGALGREIALVNVLSALAEGGKYEEIFRISEEAITNDGVDKYASNERLFSVCVRNVQSLSRRHRYDEFVARAEALLRRESIVLGLKESLLANLIHHFNAIDANTHRAAYYANMVAQMAASGSVGSGSERYMAINNAAYAFIQAGELHRAEQLLQTINHLMHVEPYPTATLGFLHITKGHVERGTALYKEAMQLLKDGQVKRLFAQKLNLELGRYLLRQEQPLEARKYLTLVLQIKDGVPAFLFEAESLMARLRG